MKAFSIIGILLSLISTYCGIVLTVAANEDYHDLYPFAMTVLFFSIFFFAFSIATLVSYKKKASI